VENSKHFHHFSGLRWKTQKKVEKGWKSFENFTIFSVKNVWKTNDIFHSKLCWKNWICQPVLIIISYKEQGTPTLKNFHTGKPWWGACQTSVLLPSCSMLREFYCDWSLSVIYLLGQQLQWGLQVPQKLGRTVEYQPHCHSTTRCEFCNFEMSVNGLDDLRVQ
jgi:hypothetical protein